MAVVIVVGARVLVRGVAGQEVVAGDEQSVTHVDDGFILPRWRMMRRERAAKAPLVDRTLAARAASGRAEPAIAMAGAAGAVGASRGRESEWT